MSDLIYRQAAIDALVKAIRKDPYYDSNEAINGLGVCDVRVILNDLPSAQPELDEWRVDCKEYDKKRHCCPRWNRVIRQTLKDAERKPGRWERHYSRPGVFADLYWHCSCCGYKNENQYANVYHKFCPNCGFPMEVGEEDGKRKNHS